MAMEDLKTEQRRQNGRFKIVLLGSGQIGSTLALLAGLKQLGDIYLFDVVEGIPQGKALDLSHTSAVENFNCVYKGSNNYEDIKGADVVIVTAGVPRKPGMTRDDLLTINGKIIKCVAQNIKAFCANAFVICITNPLDSMVQLLQSESGLPASHVVGMAGTLDSSRMRYLLAEKLNVSVESVQTMIVGSHNTSMVPLLRYTTVGGIPLAGLIEMGWLSESDVQDIIQKTRDSGSEIVKHLKTGSAFMAPAASAIKMAEAYLHDKKQILLCCAYINGEYGIKNLYLGVPVVIGKQGVECVVEVPLTTGERSDFNESARGVKDLWDRLVELKADF